MKGLITSKDHVMVTAQFIIGIMSTIDLKGKISHTDIRINLIITTKMKGDLIKETNNIKIVIIISKTKMIQFRTDLLDIRIKRIEVETTGKTIAVDSTTATFSIETILTAKTNLSTLPSGNKVGQGTEKDKTSNQPNMISLRKKSDNCSNICYLN